MDVLGREHATSNCLTWVSLVSGTHNFTLHGFCWVVWPAFDYIDNLEAIQNDYCNIGTVALAKANKADQYEWRMVTLPATLGSSWKKFKISATRMNYTNLTDDTEGPDPEVQHPMPEPTKPKPVYFSKKRKNAALNKLLHIKNFGEHIFSRQNRIPYQWHCEDCSHKFVFHMFEFMRY